MRGATSGASRTLYRDNAHLGFVAYLNPHQACGNDLPDVTVPTLAIRRFSSGEIGTKPSLARMAYAGISGTDCAWNTLQFCHANAYRNLWYNIRSRDDGCGTCDRTTNLSAIHRFSRGQLPAPAPARESGLDIPNAYMGKTQRMRWSSRRTHRVAAIRVAALNERLSEKLEAAWFPDSSYSLKRD